MKFRIESDTLGEVQVFLENPELPIVLTFSSASPVVLDVLKIWGKREVVKMLS